MHRISIYSGEVDDNAGFRADLEAVATQHSWNESGIRLGRRGLRVTGVEIALLGFGGVILAPLIKGLFDLGVARNKRTIKISKGKEKLCMVIPANASDAEINKAVSVMERLQPTKIEYVNDSSTSEPHPMP